MATKPKPVFSPMRVETTQSPNTNYGNYVIRNITDGSTATTHELLYHTQSTQTVLDPLPPYIDPNAAVSFFSRIVENLLNATITFLRKSITMATMDSPEAKSQTIQTIRFHHSLPMKMYARSQEPSSVSSSSL